MCTTDNSGQNNTSLSMQAEYDTAMTFGIHHLGLTVPNIDQTAAFFIEILDYKLVAEKPHYPAKFVSDGTILLTLWQAESPSTAAAYDRKNNIGLHHFALKVANAQALDTLHNKLKNHSDVHVEFAPESLGDGPARHMMVTIPGGIRTEFIALPTP